MNDISHVYSDFMIIYIDDIMMFSKNINQSCKHLNISSNLPNIIFWLFWERKWKFVQTKVRFLSHEIEEGKYIFIDISINFVDKLFDEIKHQTQLQRFLRNLNYIFHFW